MTSFDICVNICINQRHFLRAVCPPAPTVTPGLQFQVLKVSQSDLKYPCFLFPPFFFAESWNHSPKVGFRPHLSLQQSIDG